MKRLNVLTILVMLLMPALAMGERLPDRAIDGGCYYCPYHGLPYGDLDATIWISGSGHGISKVLNAINNTQTRQKLAEEWFQFSKQSVTKTLEFRQEWLELQKARLRLQREIEQLRLEQLKLQAEIEELRIEKLQLEKENLQLQQRIRTEEQPSHKEPMKQPPEKVSG